MRPNWWRWLLYVLKIKSSPYSHQQLLDGEEVALNGAMTTIDRLRDPEYQKKVKAAKQKAKRKAEATTCMWQVRTYDPKTGAKCYYCLTHDEVAEMKEGKPPKHL